MRAIEIHSRPTSLHKGLPDPSRIEQLSDAIASMGHCGRVRVEASLHLCCTNLSLFHVIVLLGALEAARSVGCFWLWFLDMKVWQWIGAGRRRYLRRYLGWVEEGDLSCDACFELSGCNVASTALDGLGVSTGKLYTGKVLGTQSILCLGLLYFLPVLYRKRIVM